MWFKWCSTSPWTASPVITSGSNGWRHKPNAHKAQDQSTQCSGGAAHYLPLATAYNATNSLASKLDDTIHLIHHLFDTLHKLTDGLVTLLMAITPPLMLWFLPGSKWQHQQEIKIIEEATINHWQTATATPVTAQWGTSSSCATGGYHAEVMDEFWKKNFSNNQLVGTASSTGTVLQGSGSGILVFVWQRATASAGNTNHSKSNNQPLANGNSNSCHCTVRCLCKQVAITLRWWMNFEKKTAKFTKKLKQ